MASLSIAVVGLGMASKPHIAALSSLEDEGLLEIKGVYVRSPQKITSILLKYGWHSFKSIEEIEKDQNIRAVLLLTPPDSRKEYVRAFASAGKHLLIEKPIERTLKAAVSIVEVCKRSNVFLGVVFQHRFRDCSKKLRILVDQNKLGRLQLVNAYVPWWRDQSYYDVPGRGTFERDGGGVLISQAIHTLDLMLSFTGVVTELQGFVGNSMAHSMEAEDFATAGLKFSCGAVGSLMATTALFPGDQEKIEFVFSKGTAFLSGGTLRIQWRSGEVEEFGEQTGTGGGSDPMAFPSDWHRSLIKDFVESVSGGVEPKSSGASALKVHKLIDAIMKSGSTGQKICF